jgi:L-aminopeptidase/D-esterase-like protein
LTKAEATKVAMMAHNGYARSINPVHTMYDGDTVFCMSSGSVTAKVSAVGTLAADVVSASVIAGIKAARMLNGVPAYDDVRR